MLVVFRISSFEFPARNGRYVVLFADVGNRDHSNELMMGPILALGPR